MIELPSIGIILIGLATGGALAVFVADVRRQLAIREGNA